VAALPSSPNIPLHISIDDTFSLMLPNPAYSPFEGRTFIYVFGIFKYVVLLIGLLLQLMENHLVQKTLSPRHSG
jgi:hypothetical protein